MNHFRYIPLLTILATLTACESSDMPIQHADSYGYITFSASTEKTISRSNPYEAFSPDKHPGNMGVFGYHDISNYGELTPTRAGSTPNSNPIYKNEQVNYSASGDWTPTTEKKWDDYLGATNFDFFAYMPKVEEAKVEREVSATGSTASSSNAYSLSFPFVMTQTSADAESGANATEVPLIYDVKSAPLICAKPEHKEGTDAEGKEFTFDRVVKFQFDQTLTAYQLLFKLDPKMGAVRQFRLKKVTLSGELATGCTIARTYTYDASSKSWTAGNIDWKDIQRKTFNNFQLTNTKEMAVVTAADYTQWGETFYTIPDAKFSPTLTATYDVEFVAQDKTTVVTRKDVTSTIVLNKENFDKLVTTETAIILPIRILIQPRYLYVLTDQDAYTGYLLVE